MPSPNESLRQKLDMMPDNVKDALRDMESKLAEMASAHFPGTTKMMQGDDAGCSPLTTLNDYQLQAMTFDRVQGCSRLMYSALGLNEEAGEVAGKVKKAFRDNGGLITDEIKEAIAYELGDVLWYVAMTSKEIGYDLNSIAEMNISKLTSRRKRGVIGGNGDNR